MTGEVVKRVTHVGVRFYRIEQVDVALVPLLGEVSAIARSAGDGYFLVSLLGEPGSAYPLDSCARRAHSTRSTCSRSSSSTGEATAIRLRSSRPPFAASPTTSPPRRDSTGDGAPDR